MLITVSYWDHNGLTDSQISVASLLPGRQTVVAFPKTSDVISVRDCTVGLNYLLKINRFQHKCTFTSFQLQSSRFNAGEDLVQCIKVFRFRFACHQNVI